MLSHKAVLSHKTTLSHKVSMASHKVVLSHKLPLSCQALWRSAPGCEPANMRGLRPYRRNLGTVTILLVERRGWGSRYDKRKNYE